MRLSFIALHWTFPDKLICCVKAAKSLLESKASVSTVGDLYVLPFAEEIGLTV